MLTYDLSSRGNVPIYLYLYNCIKADIENGVIKPDEKLPSKRNLAEHLKISVLTVQNAYLALLSEGYLYSRVRSGYYASALEHVNRTAPVKKAETDEPVQKEPEWVIDFCDNNIDAANFPFSIWSKQMREVLNEGVALEKIPAAGVLALRIAIADFLYHFRGMAVSPEQIIIGAGTEYLYGLLVKLLGKDKIYAVEDPGYRKIAAVYHAENVECRYIGLDKHGISSAELAESGADIVHISPAHHFPTGIVMPIKRRQEILNWANEQAGRFIIEDDYDSEFRFAEKPIPTMQSIDAQGKVIYMNTFSKTISPSIRISYLVLPQALLARFREELGFYACTVSGFEQYALAKFIQNGYFERHINRMKKAYKAKRNLIIKAIKNSALSRNAEILEENAGLHFILKLKTALSDEEIVRRAKENGIKISCLSQYCFRQEHAAPGMVIINYSGINTDRLDGVITALGIIIL
ncbi:MAG TPA: PLP-dependent aminotransferase family protein [Oscillospiraceae bacterium]|nr:PLP-dependent aminotransferase family protein [Oscillospiraceae bacterium]HPK34271.1 PLP-dependent aminotransferase family protein [Oscillospiraceae bacterium]HPR74826.1 PLP-dependent aminotransferase family protein [Oscillospiraceae bacterium]